MYSVMAYGDMIADRVRMDAYGAALRQAIKPGMRVLDLGAGPAVFSMYAVALGAAEVWAVDPDPVLELGRQLATHNGCADRIRFVGTTSDQITDAPPFDVIVSDLRGVLPLYGRHLPAIIDARERLLAPGGRLIPRRDQIHVGLLASEDAARPLAIWHQGWQGLDLRPGADLAALDFGKVRIKPDMLVGAPQCWATLDYATITSPNCEGTLEWTVDRDITAHGLVAWFDTLLGDDIGFSNAPDAPKALYGQNAFLWPEPAALRRGDRVSVQLQALLFQDDYLWRWDTDVWAEGSGNTPRRRFRQSRLLGKPPGPADLERRSSTHTPRLGARGQAAALALSLMQGTTTSGQIAAQLREQYPALFRTDADALDFVVRLSTAHTD